MTQRAQPMRHMAQPQEARGQVPVRSRRASASPLPSRARGETGVAVLSSGYSPIYTLSALTSDAE